MLAKAVHEQTMQELALIHKLAKEEGAEKTLAAVEGLMVEREGRYSKMFARMENQRRRGRRSNRGHRGGRRGGRYDQEQGYNGQRGQYDKRYDRRGDRSDDRRGYRDSRSGSGSRQDDYYEEDRRPRR